MDDQPTSKRAAENRGIPTAQSPVAPASHPAGGVADSLPGKRALLAAVYARVIHGYLLDRAVAGADSPTIILELNARSARHGYRLIRHLVARWRRLGAAGKLPFIYVMATADDEALAGWQARPWLEGLVERGVLDFARVDVRDDSAEFVVRRAGVQISADTKVGSLVVIANQVFSAYPQPQFYVEGGQLFRRVPRGADAADHELERVADGAAYERAIWNEVLAGYAERLDSAALSFPTCALSWLERVANLSECGMLLCAERGCPLPSLAGGARDPCGDEFNFDALAKYVLRTGGMVLSPAQRGQSLDIMGFLYGQELTPPLETVRAYQDAIAEPFGLEDWLALEPLIEASLASASAQQLCAYVRLSGWDEACFMRCMPHLLARVQSGSVSAQVGLGVVRMVDQVWLGHLPEIDPEPDERQDVAPDLAFVMALLLFGLERYERAIALFESSLALRGSSAAVLYNMALCAAQLGQSQRALEHVDAALALDSNFPGASEMRLRLMSRL